MLFECHHLSYKKMRNDNYNAQSISKINVCMYAVFIDSIATVSFLVKLCMYRYADMWQRRGMQLDVMTAWCSWFISPWPAKPSPCHCLLPSYTGATAKISIFQFFFSFLTVAPTIHPLSLSATERTWPPRSTNRVEDTVGQIGFWLPCALLVSSISSSWKFITTFVKTLVRVILGRALAQSVIFRLLTAGAGFTSRAVRVVLWWMKWHLDRFLRESFRFPI